jgi:hypothetical protein
MSNLACYTAEEVEQQFEVSESPRRGRAGPPISSGIALAQAGPGSLLLRCQ